MLSASNIQFRTKKRTILDATDLAIQPGEIMAILGPNGAGKTTLFNLLSGDSTSSFGVVKYNGKNIARLKANKMAEMRAVMPQYSTVNFPFTVREVVELGLISNQAKNPEKVLDEVMSLTQIDHLQQQEYEQLSGGEKQRVQLSRVLAQVWEKNLSQGMSCWMSPPLA